MYLVIHIELNGLMILDGSGNRLSLPKSLHESSFFFVAARRLRGFQPTLAGGISPCRASDT